MAWDGGGGDEARSPSVGAEEPQHRGRAVELPKPAAEAGVGDETGPALADEGGAHEEMGLYLGEAEEDLLDEIIRHRRRRHDAPLGQEDAGGPRHGLLRLVRRVDSGGGATATLRGIGRSGEVLSDDALEAPAGCLVFLLFATPENLKSPRPFGTENLNICASQNAMMLWSADS